MLVFQVLSWKFRKLWIFYDRRLCFCPVSHQLFHSLILLHQPTLNRACCRNPSGFVRSQICYWSVLCLHGAVLTPDSNVLRWWNLSLLLLFCPFLSFFPHAVCLLPATLVVSVSNTPFTLQKGLEPD